MQLWKATEHTISKAARFKSLQVAKANVKTKIQRKRRWIHLNILMHFIELSRNRIIWLKNYTIWQHAWPEFSERKMNE